MSRIPFSKTIAVAFVLFLIALQVVFVFSSTACAEDGRDAAQEDSPTIDGTTGMLLGGLGTGAIKFCAHNGTFVGTVIVPCAQQNFQSMGNTCFQFFTRRECKVSAATGVHNLYLVFTDDEEYLLNLNWIKIHKQQMMDNELAAVVAVQSNADK